ncbi:MAG: glycosyltransferase family 1 protein [Nitrososphaeria archaeon]|nr:glycosyltransferase family 1 protein [Nitrososphaeria archaeon]NDB88492.1 glycosyltransferase family 1 protein [Nitrososphaerota archaeon]NDF26994.1 glycosyltransferase family 1 protein [Nitrosopumilaceae archaeon]NDB46684.1 glycosyltransferase family 1 protein [Nitrososphaeria archaeon]NDB90371.1 glycosyltransferase family 1 protein [Nitrososphaerota archaeon]
MKILAIGDTADNIFTLKKFAKKSTIHLITFPRKQDALFTNLDGDTEFFDSLLISKQVKKINSIKHNFDLCVVMTWAAARIAYLADLNYIMYFVGDDIRTPPFEKKPKLSYLNQPAFKRNLIERYFYGKIFRSAIACVTTGHELYQILKQYREDAIRVDRIAVDVKLFNENVKPIDLPKSKFVFLSAQRFSLEKGMDIIWKALKLCKSNFEVWQVKWFIQNTEEERLANEQLMTDVPSQVKFIPLIKRDELARYFVFADAILGQMRSGAQGAIERDAILCKKPVLTYTDPSRPTFLDGKEVIPPFLPRSKDPQELAKLIDQIVESKEFREKLANAEYEFVKNLSHPDYVIAEWEQIFEKYIIQCMSITKKTSPIYKKLEYIVALLLEKLVYTRTMREKNIRAWGKENYEMLTK